MSVLKYFIIFLAREMGEMVSQIKLITYDFYSYNLKVYLEINLTDIYLIKIFFILYKI